LIPGGFWGASSEHLPHSGGYLTLDSQIVLALEKSLYQRSHKGLPNNTSKNPRYEYSMTRTNTLRKVICIRKTKQNKKQFLFLFFELW